MYYICGEIRIKYAKKWYKMEKGKEVFKKVWINHFDHSEELDEQLEIILQDHDYIFEAMWECAEDAWNARISLQGVMNFEQYWTS